MVARHQYEHEQINAREYPGTRQLCAKCEEPTERCEEDAIYTEDGDGPLCVECWHKTDEYILANVQDQGSAPCTNAANQERQPNEN